jgi:hypothetical protein
MVRSPSMQRYAALRICSRTFSSLEIASAADGSLNATRTIGTGSEAQWTAMPPRTPNPLIVGIAGLPVARPRGPLSSEAHVASSLVANACWPGHSRPAIRAIREIRPRAEGRTKLRRSQARSCARPSAISRRMTTSDRRGSRYYADVRSARCNDERSLRGKSRLEHATATGQARTRSGAPALLHHRAHVGDRLDDALKQPPLALPSLRSAGFSCVRNVELATPADDHVANAFVRE